MIQLRILLAPLLAFISLQCFAQQYPEYAIDGNGFKSIFQDLESGNFNGTVNGILIVKDSDNQKSLLDFQGSYAKLEIEKDEYEVYDLSYKNYIGKTTSYNYLKNSYIKWETFQYFTHLLSEFYYILNCLISFCSLGFVF